MLDRLFVDQELPDEASAASLYTQLRSDAAAQRRFDALALTSRELQPDVDVMSPMERAFSAAHFMHALDAQLAEEAKENTTEPTRDNVVSLAARRPARLTHPMQLTALAAALLGTLAAALLLGPEPHNPLLPEEDGFQARSLSPAHRVAHPSTHAIPTLSLFCIASRAGDEPEIHSAEEAPFGVLSCRADEALAFAAKNPDPAMRYVALFGVDASGRILWYGPSPAAPEAIALTQHEEPAPIGSSIQLAVNHRPGPVAVHALFSPRPIDHAILTQWLRGESLSADRPLPSSALPDEVRLVRATFDVLEVPQ